MKRALAALLACGLASPLGAVEVHPKALYEFTSGSGGYTSHNGAGGLMLRWKNRWRFYGYYSLFTDDDYSLVQTGTFRLRAPVGEDWEASAAVLLSSGKLKDSDQEVSSTALDLEVVRFLGFNWDLTGGYRYTDGTLHSGVNRETVTVPEKHGRPRTVTVTQELTREYASHTLSAALGYDFSDWVKGFYMDGRLALTSRTDGAPTYSQALEASLSLPRDFAVGAAFTLTQTADGPDRDYLGFSISKTF